MCKKEVIDEKGVWLPAVYEIAISMELGHDERSISPKNLYKSRWKI